jgi:hypothetical protein
MDQEYLMHLNKLLSLLEEDANEIRNIMQGVLLSPYKKLLDQEIRETEREIRQEQRTINWR